MQDPRLPADAFLLGTLTVVPSLNRLIREGAAQDLEPRVMRVLAALAETPGEVVPREALVDAVWADAVVNEEALTRAVSELRKALADGAPGAVETIRGTGYRLALPVRPAPRATPAPERAVPTAGGTPARSGRRLALAAMGLAAVALAVAVWAARPRGPETSSAAGADPAFRLDSTSRYFVPGMSELGVYDDSSTGSYFRFAPEADSAE